MDTKDVDLKFVISKQDLEKLKRSGKFKKYYMALLLLRGRAWPKKYNWDISDDE